MWHPINGWESNLFRTILPLLSCRKNWTIFAGSTLNSTKGTTYTDNFRKAGHHCLLNSVPMGNVSDGIEGVARSLCNSELSHTPCTSTIGKMISKKVTSSVWAIEAILNSEKVNLAWDTTNLNGNHINDVHVSTDSGIFLGISERAGGTAEDYHDDILTALCNASTNYAKSRQLDSQVILQRFQAPHQLHHVWSRHCQY